MTAQYKSNFQSWSNRVSRPEADDPLSKQLELLRVNAKSYINRNVRKENLPCMPPWPVSGFQL